MKRTIALTLALCCIMLCPFGCGQKDIVQTIVPLEALPEDYSLENAKSDHCVVYEDLDITYGHTEWESFVKETRAGKTATVRLAFYYTLSAHLFIENLSFDGKKYTIELIDDDTKFSTEYAYLVKYEGKPHSQSALFSDYVYYVLVNDDTITWEEIEDGMASSQSGAAIDHFTVYSDLTYK